MNKEITIKSFEEATVVQSATHIGKPANGFGTNKPRQDTTIRPDISAHEPAWSLYLAHGTAVSNLKGIAEYRTPDGSFCDILTDDGYCCEVEWANHWKESVGQALYYAAILDKKPKVVLLSRDKRVDKIYYLRLMVVCAKYDIEVVVIDVT